VAFTVQDDTGTVDGANAYIDADFFNDYHGDRGVDLTELDDSSEAAVQGAIVQATGYMDSRWRYLGWPLEDDQTTEWPRDGVYEQRGNLADPVPLKVQQACAEYALAILRGSSLTVVPALDESGRPVVETVEKVGPVEERKRFAEGGGLGLLALPVPAADMLLSRYVSMVSGGVAVR
jgi:hypothetical protein